MAAAVDDDDDELSTSSRGRAAPAPAVAPAAKARPAAASSAASLEGLLGDESISAVIVSGPDAVHVERAGRLEGTSLDLGDATALADRLRRLAATGVPAPEPGASFIDVRLADGARLIAAFPPLAGASAVAAIRKAARADRSLDELVGDGTLSREMREVLASCAAGRRNILVGGDREALGPFVSALAAGLPGDARVVSLGGPSLGSAGWVGLAADSRAVRAAAALRPDHVIAAELADGWATELLTAAALGMDGLVVGLGARTALEALARLEVLAGQPSGTTSARELVHSTIDLVVHVASLAGGSIRVTEICDVRIGQDGRLQAEPLFRADAGGDGKLSGRFVATGTHPRCAAGLAARGTPLAPALFRK